MKQATVNPFYESDSVRSFWNSTAFTLVIRGTLTFVLLTVIAMFIYPGGTMANRNSVRYSWKVTPAVVENRLDRYAAFICIAAATSPRLSGCR